MLQSPPDWVPSLHLGHSEVKATHVEQFNLWRARRRSLPRNESLSAGRTGAAALRSEVKDAASKHDTEERKSSSLQPSASLLGSPVDFTVPVPKHSAPGRPPDWQDPVLHDHDYCTGKTAHNTMTPCSESDDFKFENNSDALFFTGISLEVFNILAATLEKSTSNEYTISVRDQVLITLVKLKTNCVIGDLSRQFSVSQSEVGKIISYWIDKLDEVLRPLIPWLPRETIQATMPDALKQNFPDTTCMLDCSEICVQRSQKDDTLKYQVAVAPCGLIMFVSAAYGSRCSDRFITMNSGILKLFKPGDEVIAVRGFTFKDLLSERNVKLVMPFFGQETERMARVGVHVEKAFRRLKVFKILTQVVSSALSQKLNKILRICAALVNLREDLTNDPLA